MFIIIPVARDSYNETMLHDYYRFISNTTICQGNRRRKPQVAEEEPEVEVITKVEFIYEDAKATTGVEPEYKWGEVYRMISSQRVPDAGFEDMPMYANIERSALMKVATRPEIFPCSEVIG